jgi:hypothetical protein
METSGDIVRLPAETTDPKKHLMIAKLLAEEETRQEQQPRDRSFGDEHVR